MQALALAARQEGAILPGNHDGLMFGIFNHKFVGRMLEASGQAWYRGCLRGATEASGGAPVSVDPHDAVVTKRDFILAYLALFGTRPEAPHPDTPAIRRG